MTKFIFVMSIGLLITVATAGKSALADDDTVAIITINGVGNGEQLGINLFLTSPEAECVVSGELKFVFPTNPNRETAAKPFYVSNEEPFFTSVMTFVLGRDELRLPVVVEVVGLRAEYSGRGRCALSAGWDLRGTKEGDTRAAESGEWFFLISDDPTPIP